MKTNTKTQLSLFTLFMGKELLPNNDYVTYIETSSNNNNIVHKESVTSTISNNIKKLLNSQSRIEAIKSQSFEEFSKKYESIIYEEQDRRILEKKSAIA